MEDKQKGTDDLLTFMADPDMMSGVYIAIDTGIVIVIAGFEKTAPLMRHWHDMA